MKDPRYLESELFDRRSKEWDLENIKEIITKLFSWVCVLDGWSLQKVEWIPEKVIKKEELKRSLIKVLSVVICKGDIEFNYTLQIPKLTNRQLFFIGGYYKIPMFQLFDMPIIYRNKILKLRTNTITAGMNLEKNHNVSIFNRNIPIDLLLCNLYDKSELDTFLKTLPGISTTVDSIVQNCHTRWNSKTKDELLYELGSIFSTSYGDQERKAENVIFSIKLAYEIDEFSKKFFETDSLLFEILQKINQGPRSDTNMATKRLRFSEYILSPLIKKVYDMIVSSKISSKTKFQIAQTIIFDLCNRGEIVRQSTPFNPVAEIASFSQVTLTGPGGFKKDNIPGHLRNLDNSQFGIICPADTPDRTGCGVTLNLVPTVKLDDNGMFIKNKNGVVCSYPISLTPFLEHDDQVRLQMASSQLKQSISLINSEKPFIRSGVENCYTNESTFINIARDKGKVLYRDNEYLIVMYDNDDALEFLKIGLRNMGQAIDNIRTNLQIGDTFNQGDILCESSFLENGELKVGRNLLAGIMIWKGFNYEDGIVISKSVSEKMFTSPHHLNLDFTIDTSHVLLSLLDDQYKPLPDIGQTLKKGEVYARLKPMDYVEGLENINIEPIELVAPNDCTIVDIKIYPNYWNKKIINYDAFISKMIFEQSSRFAKIDSCLRKHLTHEDAEFFEHYHNISRLDCKRKKEKYNIKGHKINGVYFEIHAIFNEQIGIGDKIANRHGNKGVISLIEDDEMMPVLPDGRKCDIILNPLGIISRMNAGQLYELHLSECLYQTKERFRKYLEENDIKKIREDMDFVFSIIDKTEDRWITNAFVNMFEQSVKENKVEKFIDEFYFVQPPFQSIDARELNKLFDFLGVSDKYKLFNPQTDSYVENDIACGYMYFNKLVHRASDKLSARSIGPYSRKTSQPLGGKSRQGGHRVGEMEVWAIQAHGAESLLKDLLTVQADSIGLKSKFLSDLLNNPELSKMSNELDTRTQSFRLLDSNLTLLGVELKNHKGEISDSVESDGSEE